MQYSHAHPTDEATKLEQQGRLIARQIAQEAIVILENDGVLPLAPQRIALFGTGASKTIAGGSGSGEVNVRHSASVREGFKAAGFEIATDTRLDAYEQTWRQARQAFVEQQREKLRFPTPNAIAQLIGAQFQHPADAPITHGELSSLDVDACVYVLARQSGEGLDRTDHPGSFRLTAQELEDIRICASSFEKTVVVLNVGAPIDVSWFHEIEGVNALVHMGQLGQEGGYALADVVSGAVSPSGKLAVTWPKSISQVPFSDDYGRASANPDEADYSEGIYVGYRYYTSFDVQPAYLFGHGLGYTRFEESLHSVAVQNGKVAVSVDVRNVEGAFAGKHVVQLYASSPAANMDKEACRLVAFAKSDVIDPGETATIKLAFSVRDLASYDQHLAQTCLESGLYQVFLGDTPARLQPAFALRATDSIVLEQHRNLCVCARRTARLQTECKHLPNSYDGEVFDIEAGSGTFVHAYGNAAAAATDVLDEVLAVVDALPIKDQIRFCVGTGLADEGEGPCVPGAVGHTTAKFIDYGIPSQEMCDGPAGLRLQRRSALTREGKIKPIDPPLSIYEYLPSGITSRMFGNPKRDKVVYQFVTGFPAASSVAQTWNTPLAHDMGHIVGCEMVEYGVRYWLAPALNIVRNPLCGRNFEYYSEDPIVSGKMASAVVRGVQSLQGRFACLKHFAANNQETNRNTSSSNVDERVLREIYLRGFEIAVREAKPASIMASYNKVNGVYAPENAELLTAILRDEWGFAGIVMTDWFATGFGHADECKALAAGTDLIMPGGMLSRLSLSMGLKMGRLSPEVLRRACARIMAQTLREDER